VATPDGVATARLPTTVDAGGRKKVAAATAEATLEATIGAHGPAMATRVPPRRNRGHRSPTIRPLPSRPPDLTPPAARRLLTLLLVADRQQAAEPDVTEPPPDDAA